MAPGTSEDSPADIDLHVYAERIGMLYRFTPMTLLSAVFLSAILLGVLAEAVPFDKLATWFGLNCVVSGIRYLQILHFRRRAPMAEDVKRWVAPFVALVVLAGAVWALLGTWLLPTDPIYRSINIISLAGVAAVGMFTLSYHLGAYLAMVVPALLVPVALLMISAGPGEVPLGIAILFFFLVVLANAWRNLRSTQELLRLRFRNARIAVEREIAQHNAEEASKAKGEFLANMSHEIRTPLIGVLGMAQLLDDTPLNEDQRHKLRVVQHSGEHLLGLLNDILDVSKIEAGKLSFVSEPLDLRQTIVDVWELFETRMREKALEPILDLAPDLPRWVLGDSARLRQVLNNLLGNALKFTESGSVRLAVRLNEPGRKANLRFDIIDTGIGIPHADLTQIFESFQQGDNSAARRYAGSGLGLTISRQLVSAMGGDIGCDSALGGGSTFWFSIALPETAAPAMPPPTAATLPRGGLRGRILLVEDNNISAEVARYMLSGFGLSVDWVASAEDALIHAENARYDLILMDCQLPQMDGYEATGILRRREQGIGQDPTPIVALTAHALQGERKRCLAAGMDDYVVKPFSREDLLKALLRNLRETHADSAPPT
ncbi:MAG: ATP-binding protein [Rhodocyclaceae bacterium]